MKMPGRGLVIATGLSTSVTRIGSSIWASSVPPGGLTSATPLPARVVETRTRPARHLAPGVVFLAVEFVVRSGGTRVVKPPVGVADHVLDRAVLVFEAELEQQLGKPVGRHRHGDVSAGGEITAVAQDDADRIVARMDVAGHVERDVKGAAVVSGQGRVHELVADPLAVQVQVEEAEAANVGRRPSDLFGDLELVAQQSRGQAAVVRPADLAPRGRSRPARLLGMLPRRVVKAILFPARDFPVAGPPVESVGTKSGSPSSNSTFRSPISPAGFLSGPTEGASNSWRRRR